MHLLPTTKPVLLLVAKNRFGGPGRAPSPAALEWLCV